MNQDKDTGAFHFSGDEDEVAMRWLWSCLLDTSFWGRVELTWRIWFKKPPAFVGYKKPEVYQKICQELLQGLEKKVERLARRHRWQTQKD
jgi:hypothetical protein